MGTIVHAFDPGATVYVITPAIGTCPLAIQEGTVIQVRANALTTGTAIKYDVRLGNDSGTTEFDEADIHATLDGSPGGAVDAYKAALT